MEIEKLKQDYKNYWKFMMDGNVDGCIVIEKRYDVYGGSPEMVTNALAELIKQAQEQSAESPAETAADLGGETPRTAGREAARERNKEMETIEFIMMAKNTAQLGEIPEGPDTKDQAIALAQAYALIAIAQELKRVNDLTLDRFLFDQEHYK